MSEFRLNEPPDYSRYRGNEYYLKEIAAQNDEMYAAGVDPADIEGLLWPRGAVPTERELAAARLAEKFGIPKPATCPHLSDEQRLERKKRTAAAHYRAQRDSQEVRIMKALAKVQCAKSESC